MNWYLKALKQYADFSGRARRKEYWFFSLFNLIFLILSAMLDNMLGTFNQQNGVGLLSGIYSLAIIIPGIAVSVRRLHDTNRSGWMLLIGFIPIIGSIWLLILMLLDSTPETNRFGDCPKLNNIGQQF